MTRIVDFTDRIEKKSENPNNNTISIFECTDSTIICNHCVFHMENQSGTLFTLNNSKIM